MRVNRCASASLIDVELNFFPDYNNSRSKGYTGPMSDIKFENPGLHWGSIWLTIGIFVLGAFLSWQYCDWSLFPRTGVFGVCLGLAKEGWDLLTEPNQDKTFFWGSQHGHNAQRTALLIIVVSTLVWGFGDLVPNNLCR